MESKINFLNKISSNIDKNFLNKGIKSIYLTIHPLYDINIPLETVFKIINTNNNLPLIKYNSGSGLENIYRLYTGNHISTNGKKIPSLYVNYNKRTIKIRSLAKYLARQKRIGFFVLDELNEVYCELLNNGNIEIKMDFIQPVSYSEIEKIIVKTINKEILSKINDFTSEIGHEYTFFESIFDDNIEINNINYVYSFKYQKK